MLEIWSAPDALVLKATAMFKMGLFYARFANY